MQPAFFALSIPLGDFAHKYSKLGETDGLRSFIKVGCLFRAVEFCGLVGQPEIEPLDALRDIISDLEGLKPSGPTVETN